MNLKAFTRLYADLLGYLASVSPPSSIPTNLFTSLSRPDSVLISKDSMYLFELTIPTNTQQHLLTARAQKEDRYGSLLYDLQCTGLVVDLVSIEIAYRMSGSLYARNTCSSGYCLLQLCVEENCTVTV